MQRRHRALVFWAWIPGVPEPLIPDKWTCQVPDTRSGSEDLSNMLRAAVNNVSGMLVDTQIRGVEVKNLSQDTGRAENQRTSCVIQKADPPPTWLSFNSNYTCNKNLSLQLSLKVTELDLSIGHSNKSFKERESFV